MGIRSALGLTCSTKQLLPFVGFRLLTYLCITQPNWMIANALLPLLSLIIVAVVATVVVVIVIVIGIVAIDALSLLLSLPLSLSFSFSLSLALSLSLSLSISISSSLSVSLSSYLYRYRYSYRDTTSSGSTELVHTTVHTTTVKTAEVCLPCDRELYATVKNAESICLAIANYMSRRRAAYYTSQCK